MLGFREFYGNFLLERVGNDADQDARAKVLKLGQDGFEHMVALSKDGELFTLTSNSAKHVAFDLTFI